MGVGFTRQSTFSNGDVVDAPEVNSEFDQLVSSFVAATGHNHNGDPANGGLIPLIANSGRTASVEITSGAEVQVTGNLRTGDVFADDITATGTTSVAGITGTADITTTANMSAVNVTSTGTLNANNVSITGTVTGLDGTVLVYDNATTYSQNDIVISGNFLFISLVDSNTGNTPISSPTQWRLFWDTVKSYVETTETTATDSQLDFQDSNVHVRTPTVATTYSLENIPTTGSTKIELFLTNNGQTITWPNVTWEVTGTEPTLGTVDRIIFSKYEGVSTIYALHVPVVA